MHPARISTYGHGLQVSVYLTAFGRHLGFPKAQLSQLAQIGLLLDIGKIKLPLALPVLFAGVRTAAVQVVSGAVLAAYIGGGGLGDFITAGIAMMAVPQLLVGAIPVTLLSLGADYAFGALQRQITPRGLREADA